MLEKVLYALNAEWYACFNVKVLLFLYVTQSFTYNVEYVLSLDIEKIFWICYLYCFVCDFYLFIRFR